MNNTVEVYIHKSFIPTMHDSMEDSSEPGYYKLKHVESDVVFVEEHDGNLKGATLKYLSYSASKISQYAPVYIYALSMDSTQSLRGEINNYYIVASDTISKISNIDQNYRYEHILSLVEPTVYLEKIIVPPHRNFRKYRADGTAATLKDQVNDELLEAMGPVVTGSPKRTIFRLNLGLASILDTYPVEEFRFDNDMNLREILDEMLEKIDSKCIVNSITDFTDIVINRYSYGTTSSGKNIPTEYNGFTETPNFDNLSKQIEVRGTNAICPIKPVINTGWGTFRANDGSSVLTTDNVGIVTEHPIETIKSFKVKLHAKIDPIKLARSLEEGAASIISKVATGIVNTAKDLAIGAANFFIGVFGGEPLDPGEDVEIDLTGNIIGTLDFDLPEIDISKYVIDIEEYNKLDTDTQKSRIPYERGTKTIGVGTYTTVLYVPVVNFTLIVADALTNQILPDATDPQLIDVISNIVKSATAFVDWFDNLASAIDNLVGGVLNLLGAEVKGGSDSLFSLTESQYKCEFVPYIDIHARFSKDNIDGLIPETVQMDNQSDRNLDTIRYGELEKKKVNSIGNTISEIPTCVESIDQLLDIGTYFLNAPSVVVTNREYSIQPHCIEVAYRLTNNYESTHNRVSLDRQKRVYDIPLAKDAIDRPVLFKTYVQLSSKPLVDNHVINTVDLAKGLKPYAYENRPVELTEKTIKYALIETSSDDTGTNADTIPGSYQVLVARYCMGTSVLFSMVPHDNYSIGTGKSERVVGGIGVTMNRYVNKNTGRYDHIGIQLSNDRGEPNKPIFTKDDIREIYDKLPLVNYYDWVNYRSPGRASLYSFQSSKMQYDFIKDAYDRDKWTVQVEFVSVDPNIFITDKIAQINAFIGFEKNSLKLYRSKTLTYNKNSKKALGDYKARALIDNLVRYQGGSNLRVYEDWGNNDTNWASWGIADADGNLLIGYNCTNDNKIEDENDHTQHYYNLFMSSNYSRNYTVDSRQYYTVNYIDPTNGDIEITEDFSFSSLSNIEIVNNSMLPELTPTDANVTFVGWYEAIPDGNDYIYTDTPAYTGRIYEDKYYYPKYLTH